MTARVRLTIVIFLQMLPATMVVPAIRPLFALRHGTPGAMHAFMAVNMVGAALLVPLVGSWLDRGRSRARLLRLLAGADALLLFALTTAVPAALLLGLRLLEGAAHVGAATVLVTEASGPGGDRRHGRAMGAAGAGIVAAIVSGSAFGALLVRLDPRAPLWVASGLAAVVAVVASRVPFRDGPRPAHARRRFGEALALLRARPALRLPVTAAFVGRFTIGCVVVTFALFAHAQHALGDGAIGGLFTLMTLPFALATYPAARMTDRVPAVALLRVGMAGLALSLAGVAYAPTAALPALMAAAGVASGVVFGGLLARSAAVAGAGERGRAMALVNVAGCVGMLLGPTVGGILTAVLSRKVGPVAAYRAVFLVAAMSALGWIVLHLKTRSASAAALEAVATEPQQ